MIIWGDGFDHYTTANELEDGSYVRGNAGLLTLSTANPRTGDKHVRLNSGLEPIRYAYPAGPSASIGLAFASYFDFLPSYVTHSNYSITWSDIGNTAQVMCQFYPNGSVVFTRGDGTTLYTSAPVITAGAYQHLEFFVTIHNSAGVIKMRVNNIEVVNQSGLDTCNSANVETSQVSFRAQDFIMISGTAPDWDIDDLYLYDTTGSRDNAYPVGDLECILLDTNGDTAEADWAKSTGVTGYTLLADASDSTYISTSSVSDRSDFDLEDLPADINYIACLFLHTRASKSDASPAQIQASIMSGANQGLGADRAITTVPTFWHDMLDVDPATGVRWTKIAVDACKFRIDRTV
jgi:hypothetical protein